MERKNSSNQGTKKLEPRIVDAFKTFGFEPEEIQAGCWLLERNNKPIAWIALHKFLERVAQKANIVFDEPKVMNCTEKEVAVYVNGHVSNVSAWSIGEASVVNCKNDYRWAMAEKRAKDRVILKLLGVAGDMYSEEEADEFKNQPIPEQKDVQDFKDDAKKEQTQVTKALKNGENFNPLANSSNEELLGRFTGCLNWIKSTDLSKAPKGQIDTTNRYIDELERRGLTSKSDELRKELNAKIFGDDEVKF